MSAAKPYCNCQTNRVHRHYEFGHGNLVPVEVDANGMCALCGHAPVWKSKHVRYLRQSKLKYSGWQPIVLSGTNYLTEWERAGFDRDVARCLKEGTEFEGHLELMKRPSQTYLRTMSKKEKGI